MHSKNLNTIAGLIVLFAFDFTGTAVAAPGWTAPATLGSMTSFNLPSNNASLAVAANGDSTAVWVNESNNAVQYAQRKSGTWSPAKTLYTASATKNETTSSAHVVMKPDGSAVAIFASTTPGTLQYCVAGGRVVRCLGPNKSLAKLATLPAGGTSWTKSNVSGQGVLVDDTQIAIDASGNLLASWRFQAAAGQPTQLQVASQASNNAWSAPQILHSSSNPLSFPSLSLAASGHALLVWQETQNSASPASFALRARYRDPAGVWSPLENAATLPVQSWTLRSGIDVNGLATLVWDNDYAVQLSRRSNDNPSSPWSPAETLASVPGTRYGPNGPFAAYAPDLAVSAAGDVLVGWLENDLNTGMWQIEAQIHGANGTTQSRSSWPVDPQNGNGNPSASFSVDGSIATVGWIDNGTGDALLASYTPASGWGAASTIGTGLWGSQIAVASGLNGNASAIWWSNTATEFKYKILASSYVP